MEKLEVEFRYLSVLDEYASMSMDLIHNNKRFNAAVRFDFRNIDADFAEELYGRLYASCRRQIGGEQ